MTIKLIETIAQKAADQDGLSVKDWWEISVSFADEFDPVDRNKIEETLKIFRDLVVDTGERKRLVTLLGLDASAQRSLNIIIGSDGGELLRQHKQHLRISKLITILGDRDRNVGWRPAEKLVKIGTAAVPLLIASLKDKRNIDLSVKAWISNGVTRAPLSSLSFKNDERIINFISAAVYVLGRLKDVRAVPALIGVISVNKNKNEEVTRQAISALVTIGAGAVPALTEALYKGKGDVRFGAAEALGKIGTTAHTIPVLIEALIKGGELVKRASAEALGKVGTVAIPSLIRVLENKDECVRLYAIQAMGHFKDTLTTVPVIIKALKDKHAWVRTSAIFALEKTKDARAVPALIEVLRDNDAAVRSVAVKAVGHFKDTSVVPALIKALLNDKAFYVRYCAVMALREINDVRAIPALKAALNNDDHPGVKEVAIFALGTFNINDVCVVSALISALKDKDWRVRWPAAKFLKYSKDPRAAAALKAAGY